MNICLIYLTPLQDCENHYFVIESANIVPAIREYIKKCYHQYVNDNNSDMAYAGTTVSRLINAADVFNFWKAFTDMLSEIKEKTWIALEIGLGQYLQVSKLFYSIYGCSLYDSVSVSGIEETG